MANSLLLDVLAGRPVERPPVWLMRQAGRILPEYRALRASLSGFKELVETPALAAEATTQPVERLGVDAAIVFSDILTVPEALGLPYEMVRGFGPRFPRTLESPRDVDALLAPREAAASLGYVYDAIASSRERLGGRVPLIGFAGAPWTIFCYMVEGQGSKTFSLARRWLRAEPAASQRVLEHIAETTRLYLAAQVAAGAQAVQLFDSWAGVLSPALYDEFALPATRLALSGVDAPRISFARGAWHSARPFPEAEAHGIDWATPPEFARARYGPRTPLQGNLDPSALYAPPERIAAQAGSMLAAFGTAHVANLGHGVYPDTPLEGVEAFVEAVRAYRYEPSHA